LLSQEGLERQLLALTVAKERPDLAQLQETREREQVTS